ncbi:MAG: hypothetical protein AAB440_02180 [Patescibacteria group bacterium]
MSIEDDLERRSAIIKSALGANRLAREDAEREVQEGDERWYYFTIDMRQYLSRLEDMVPGITEEVMRAIAYLRERGRTTISSDLFGEADGLADRAVNLALTEAREKAEERITVTGNALRMSVQDSYFETIDSEDGDLVFANFNPIAGVTAKEGEDIRYKSVMLYRLFKGVYERLATPGIFVVQLWTLSKEMQQQFISQLEEERVSYTKLQHNGILRGVIVRKARKIETTPVEF